MRKLFYQRRLSTAPIPEAYQVDVKGRHRWLQKLAHAVLKRWGRHVLMEVESVAPVEIPEPERLLDGIGREIEARVGFSALAREDLVIVVGQEIYHELMMEMSGYAEFCLNRGSDLYGRPQREVFGVPVCVSSWFEGWIVLPRTAVLRPAERRSAYHMPTKIPHDADVERLSD